MTHWFRVYTEILHDEKIDAMNSDTFTFFIKLLALTKMNESDGKISKNLKYLSENLKFSIKKTNFCINNLLNLQIISDDVEHFYFNNWEKRQYKSDDINARVGDWRARKKEKQQKDVTLHSSESETLHETLQGKNNVTVQSRTDTEQNRTDTEYSILQNSNHHQTSTKENDDDVLLKKCRKLLSSLYSGGRDLRIEFQTFDMLLEDFKTKEIHDCLQDMACRNIRNSGVLPYLRKALVSKREERKNGGANNQPGIRNEYFEKKPNHYRHVTERYVVWIDKADTDLIKIDPDDRLFRLGDNFAKSHPECVERYLSEDRP